MNDINPLEEILYLTDDAVDWLWVRAHETGAHEVRTWLWDRLTEARVRSTKEAELMKKQGMDGKVGSEA